MALANRIRSSLPLFNKVLGSSTDSLASQRANLQRTLTRSPELLKNFSTATGQKEQTRVKVPKVMFGDHGKYCSSLYIVAAKANALDKVESELSSFIEASKRGPTFSQFLKDPTVPKDTRVKAIQQIAAEAKFSDITKNFLAVLASDGLLRDVERITEKFRELTMAHRGEVKAIVTTVIPLPPEEEKELKETLHEVIGQGKKVIVEQKIDASILGGIVVEFGQKVFDMSIKTRAQQMERFLSEPINFDRL